MRYSHLNPREYARYVQLATSTDAGFAVKKDVPETDPFGTCAELDNIANKLAPAGQQPPTGANQRLRHWATLCAIEGTQHSNQHSGVLAAARVLPVRAAMDMCARGGRNCFAWRPGQRAAGGRWESGGHTIVTLYPIVF